MTEPVQNWLTELFKIVADFCDGGTSEEKFVREIRAWYAKAMRSLHVRRFYGFLINTNPFNRLI